MNPASSPLQAPSPKETRPDDRTYTLQERSILDYDVQDINTQDIKTQNIKTQNIKTQDISAQDRSMNSEQTCPCCSNILLRHVSDSRIYWRCGYCFQEMPVMEDYVT